MHAGLLSLCVTDFQLAVSSSLPLLLFVSLVLMELGYLPGKMKKLEVKDRDTNKMSEVQAHMVVNAAGLYAQQLAKKMQGLPSDTIPESFLARGHYCTMEGKAARSTLVFTPRCSSLSVASSQLDHILPAPVWSVYVLHMNALFFEHMIAHVRHVLHINKPSICTSMSRC